MRITAAVTAHKGAPFMLEQVELGALRPDEVLVRIAAAGICHTDLIVRDQWYPVPLPAVLGHEGAGVVEQVGAGVTAVAPGDHVALSYHSCGHCPCCATGLPAYCHAFFAHNFGATRPDGTSALERDGAPLHAHFFGQSSFATHSVANARNVVKLDPDIPLEIVAPFGCGIQTGAGAVLNVLRPAGRHRDRRVRHGRSRPRGSAGRRGSPGARRSSASTATRRGSRWPATSAPPTRSPPTPRTRSRRSCASPAPGPISASRRPASPRVFRQAVECTAPTGVCGLIGAPAFGTDVAFDMNSILVFGRTIRGIVEGDSVPSVFLPRLIELWRQGRFPVERFMTFYDFDQIERAARDAEAGEVIKPVLRTS